MEKIACFIFLFSSMIVSVPSRAGFLSVNGQAQVEAKLNEKQMFSFKGTYNISNSGDETASEVFPTYELKKWKWTGPAQNLPANGSYVWKFDLEVPLDQLTCEKGDQGPKTCLDFDVPIRGSLPLLIRRNYQDRNGYRFSSTDVQQVILGSLSEQEYHRIQLPDVFSKFKISGNGQRFKGKLKIQNDMGSEGKMIVEYLTSSEIDTIPPQQMIEVPAHGSRTVSVVLQNNSGLIGSTYFVTAVVRWLDPNNVRNMAIVSDSLQIEAGNYIKEYCFTIVAVMILAACFLVFWIRD